MFQSNTSYFWIKSALLIRFAKNGPVEQASCVSEAVEVKSDQLYSCKFCYYIYRFNDIYKSRRLRQIDKHKIEGNWYSFRGGNAFKTFLTPFWKGLFPWVHFFPFQSRSILQKWLDVQKSKQEVTNVVSLVEWQKINHLKQNSQPKLSTFFLYYSNRYITTYFKGN